MTYIDKVGKTILPMLRMARRSETVKDTQTLHLYGYYEYTGLRGLWRKLRLGIKARRHGGGN
jgi:hypothetical protein